MSFSDGSKLDSSLTQSLFDIVDQFPLSLAQQRLWFLAQMEEVSEVYHVPLSLRLKGELDHPSLRQALDRIVARHEALRTTFATVEGEAVQRVAAVEDSRFLLIEHDLRLQSNAQAELDRIAELEISASFSLGTGPLIRGRLIRLSEDEHVLLITMHHIVSDGWSVGLLVNELSALYAAFHRGEKDPLPELEIQYPDYAVWQRKWIEGDIQRQQAAYWKTALAGAPTLLELPADHPRPLHKEYAGAYAPLELNAELTAGLKELSKRHRITLFTTMMAAWAALLARLSGQQDVLVGTPVANRGRAEIENLIGFFVNTLVVRLDLSGSISVGELLNQAKGKILAALQHQDVPFEQVVEMANPVRSLSHSPLFQVVFAWQNFAQGRVELPGLEVQPLPSPRKVSQFDLALQLRETGSTISGGIEYATSLFEQATIERYIGYFRNMLQAMVDDEVQAVDRLPILSESERHHLLYDWNDTKTAFPNHECIHELFEEQVAKSPDAVAVVFEDASISYAELNRRANRLAHYLRELGVKPDARVAVCVERSFEMVVALLAILKAGGAYVPLDPAYPVERLCFMLEDAHPVALLTQGHLQGMFAGSDAVLPVLDLTAAAPTWANQPETNLDPEAVGIKPHHLAYIIYTSGSTGQPKGVMVEHANVVRLFSATDGWFGFGPSDVWTLFHSYAFDFSVWEIWGALLYGGRLVVVPKDTVRSPSDFYKLLCEQKVTVLNQTPSAFRQLVVAQADSRSSHSLRYVVFGGEALEVATLKPWYEQNREQQTRLINMYGITETTVHVTYRPLHEADTERYGASPIGCRIPDLRTYILDAHGQPAPLGVVGELYVGGAGVARGYLNRPELTAERFVPDPFSTEPGARMYRSGDLARWLADGNMEYLGRNDFQVKIRGFRIELGEIEARLAEHPAVREAAVIARGDAPGDKQLVAYYTTAAGQDAPGAEPLRSHLAASLPEYMVPAAYVWLQALPLTPNGKLDRKALPSPAADAYSTRGYEPPQGETESTLAAIWAEVLKLERVGRHDNFFDLGGHSLLAVQLMLRIQKIVPGETLPLKAILEAPTVARLAEWLQNQEKRQYEFLVQIKPGAAASAPFFCVNAPDGYPLGLQPLALALDPDLPFYGLQLKGLDGSAPFETVEEAARSFLDEVREVQPHGPYHLGGYCFGGLVAFEMARLLEEAGESVPTLFLIDAFNPGFRKYELDRAMLLRLARFYPRRTALHLRNMVRMKPTDWLRYVSGRFHALGIHTWLLLHLVNKPNFTQLKAAASESAAGSGAAEMSVEAMLKRAREASLAAARKFVPKLYHGNAVVFRARDCSTDQFQETFLGWKQVVKGAVESFEIDAAHDSILYDPAGVRPVAEKIQAELLASSRSKEEATAAVRA